METSSMVNLFSYPPALDLPVSYSDPIRYSEVIHGYPAESLRPSLEILPLCIGQSPKRSRESVTCVDFSRQDI